MIEKSLAGGLARTIQLGNKTNKISRLKIVKRRSQAVFRITVDNSLIRRFLSWVKPSN